MKVKYINCSCSAVSYNVSECSSVTECARRVM